MASLISKKKGHPLYYYIVQSARVDGQPRIVQQTYYLGSAERLAALVKERTAPLPLSANGPRLRSARSSVAGRSGFRRLEGAGGPVAPAALGSVHRPLSVCWLPCIASANRDPRPKSPMGTAILQPLWTFSPEHFRSQDFWDALDRIRVEADPGGGPDELEEAQL